MYFYLIGEVNWVQCDRCEEWFHLLCVGLRRTVTNHLMYFYLIGEVNWVQCDCCEEWFHLLCVGLADNSN